MTDNTIKAIRADSNPPLHHSLCRQQHVFPCVQLGGVGVLPVEVLAHSFGGKLRLTDVPEVPGQVDRLTWGRDRPVIVGGNMIETDNKRQRK